LNQEKYSVLSFTPTETRAALSLSVVFLARMMGLFMLLPVLSVLARDLNGATPLLVGLAIGAYGLCQAMFQIPFGMMSDRLGRKKIVLLGLVIFVIGSLLAAASESIWGVIAGRALQGAGAISAAVMALAADLTREEMRTRMMAVLGASIGLSFIVSIVIGPLLMTRFELTGIFLIIAMLGGLAALLLWFVVPEPPNRPDDRDLRVLGSQLAGMLKDPGLLRLDLGICLLHLVITASFVSIPLGLLEAGIEAEGHWLVYLISVVLSLVIVIPLTGFGERRYGARLTLLISIAGLLLAQLALALFGNSAYWSVITALALFFGFLSVLEALLPSLVSRFAPAAGRGSAMGVYSTSQFLGAFLGGVLGGWLLGAVGTSGVFWCLAILCVGWMAIAWGTRDIGVTNFRLALHQIGERDFAALSGSLKQLPGVCEVVVGNAEKIAYMKVDKQTFDASAARNLILKYQ
jgi:MFS family permease